MGFKMAKSNECNHENMFLPKDGIKNAKCLDCLEEWNKFEIYLGGLD